MRASCRPWSATALCDKIQNLLNSYNLDSLEQANCKTSCYEETIFACHVSIQFGGAQNEFSQVFKGALDGRVDQYTDPNAASSSHGQLKCEKCGNSHNLDFGRINDMWDCALQENYFRRFPSISFTSLFGTSITYTLMQSARLSLCFSCSAAQLDIGVKAKLLPKAMVTRFSNQRLHEIIW